MHVVERTPNEKLYLIVYLLSRAPSTSIRAQSRARSIGEEEHTMFDFHDFTEEISIEEIYQIIA